MPSRADRVQAAFQWPVIIAALLVIPSIALEQSTAGGEEWKTIGIVLNWGIWLTFLAEFVAMLAVVPDRKRYVREHPLDLAIVVLTPPIVPASVQAARAFQLLRLLRLFKTARVLRNLLSTEGIRDAAVVAGAIVIGGGAAFSAVESSPTNQLTTWDGIWWAMTTVTTVGYGDPAVTTDAGRAIAMLVMLVGIGFVALITAAAADRLIATSAEEADLHRELRDINARLERMEAALLERGERG